MPSTRARGGDYNHRVAVITPTITQDSFGQEQRQWTVAMHIWAAIEPEFRPTDVFVATSATHHYEAKIWFRTRTNRAQTFDRQAMRLRHQGTDYEILDIQDPTGQNRETRLLCRQAAQP